MRNPLRGLLRLVLSLLGLGFLTGTFVAMSMKHRHDHEDHHHSGDMRQDIADRLRHLADHIEESGVMGEENEEDHGRDDTI